MNTSRESLYQMGVSFLQNATNQSLPFSEQIQFLEGKGLSSEEIKRALHAVSSSSPTSGIGAGVVKKDSWLWSVMFPIAIIGAGCTAYVLSKAMEEEDYEDRLDFCSDDEDEEGESSVAHFRDPDGMLHILSHSVEGNGQDGHGMISVDDRDLTDGSINSESVERHIDTDIHIEGLVSVIEKQTKAIQQAIELFTVSLSTVVATTALSGTQPEDSQRKEDLKLNESSLGDVGVDVITSGTGACAQPIMSADDMLDQVRGIIDEILQVSDDKVAAESEEGHVQKLGSECGRAAVWKGFSSVVMYIQKIIDNPNVSRYHRLSTTNSTFKRHVASLPEHKKLLEALGFAKRGTFWEWQNLAQKLESSKKSELSFKEEEVEQSHTRAVYFDVLRMSVVLLESYLRSDDSIDDDFSDTMSNFRAVSRIAAVPIKHEDKERHQLPEAISSDEEANSNGTSMEPTMKFEEILQNAESKS